MLWIGWLACGGVTCGPDSVVEDGVCVPVEDDGAVGASPTALTLGPVQLPCEASGEVTVWNGGDEARSLVGVTVEPSTFRVERPLTLPASIAPGASAVVSVVGAPDAVGEVSGTLRLAFDGAEELVVDVSVEAEAVHRVETFTANGAPVDILLAIDHSCSMELDNVDQVEEGLPRLLGGLQPFDWRLVQITREDGCANGGVLDASVPNAAALLIDNAWESAALTPEYLTEALLELTGLALAQTAPGGCNEGFLRPATPLRVVVLSDEAEQSGTPWDLHLDRLHTFASDVVVSGVLDVDAVCGYGAAGYADIVQATGGASLDICAPDWGASMEQLVVPPPDLAPAFPLAEAPIEGTVTVTAGGEVVAATYDPEDGIVRLDEAVARGTEVVVAYDVLATCD